MADENNQSTRDIEEDQKNHNIFRIMREIDERDLNNQYDSCSESEDDDSVSDSDEDRSHQSRLLYYLTPVRSPYPINGKTQVLSTLALARENSFSETDEDEENRAERNETNNANARNDVEEQASNDQNTNNDDDAENVQAQENKEGDGSDQAEAAVDFEVDLGQSNQGTSATQDQSAVNSNDQTEQIIDKDNQLNSSDEDVEVVIEIENKLEELFLRSKSLDDYEKFKSIYLADKTTREMRKKYRRSVTGVKPGHGSLKLAPSSSKK